MSDFPTSPFGASEQSRAPRSRPSIALMIVVWLICAGALAALISGLDLSEIARFGPLYVFIAYGAWIVLWSPTVTVSPSELTVRNLLRTFRIPWASVTRVDTRFTLTIYTTARMPRKVVAWGAPAPTSRGGARPSAPLGRMGRSRMPAMESGLAALSVRDYWEELTESGHLRGKETSEAPVVTTWQVPEAAILGGLFVVSVATIVLVHS